MYLQSYLQLEEYLNWAFKIKVYISDFS